MRLVCTLQDQKYAQVFSRFLKHEGIDNQLEIVTNSDWGSSDYGTATCRVWVYDEEDSKAALEWASIFLENPNDPKFHNLDESKIALYERPVITPEVEIGDAQQAQPIVAGPSAVLTLYFLIACVLFFMLEAFTSPPFVGVVKGLPNVVLYSSSIQKDLMYDYPHAYEIVDQLEKSYGIEKLKNLEELPPEGKELLLQYYNTPYWKGIYEQLVTRIRDPLFNWNFAAPMLEKIHEGEVWRLVTPILLHSDIFHLIFNMIWLIILGKQLELRMGRYRYLIFVLLTAMFSNTAQYLMSGPNFIGFSGVLCAMIAFVYVRQRIAAWEGYQLQRSTLLFVVIFVLLLTGIQMVNFFMEAYDSKALSQGIIANTAHLSGAFLGYILGRLNFFAWQT